MATPSKIKIDVTKIDKEFLYQGKTAKYLDAVMWENRDGPDKFDNTHYIVQDVPKEARDRGVKGAIIGNAKIVGGDSQPSRPMQNRQQSQPSGRTDSDRWKKPGTGLDDSSDEICF